jgi:hypothetical protein
MFSDRMPVASMEVVAGGKVTIITEAPHGVPVGGFVALAISDADTPNPVTAATVDADGYVHITTQFEHDLSGGSASSLNAWHEAAKLTGFALPQLGGLVQLVATEGPNQFKVLPPHPVAAITLTGHEALLERLEQGVIGWHKVTAASATTFEFATPEDVGRSYTVPYPKIVQNIRVAGAINLETAQRQYVRGYEAGSKTETAGEMAKCWLFITPQPSVRLSKDRNSGSDAVTEITPGADYRQMLIDGYHVYAFLPAEKSAGGVGCSDLAHGDVLGVVLRTFHGLALPRRELYAADTYVSMMVEHGSATGHYDGATYIHGYVFEAPAMLTQMDAIQTFEWSRIDETQMTAASGLGPGTGGGTIIPGPITPAGSVSIRGIEFGTTEAGGDGIRHDDAPQPLTGIVRLS